MLKTLTSSLKGQKQDRVFGDFVIEANSSAITRDILMDEMGDDPEENLTDEEMQALIDGLPETDIEDEQSLTEGTAKVKDVVDGEEKDVPVDEIIENFVPETEY